LQYPGAALDNRVFTLNIRPNQGGFRVGTVETNALGITYGLRGNMPSLDWDWEIYHGYSRNTSNISAENNVGATAMRQLINGCGVTTLAVQAQPLLTLPNCPFPNKTGEVFVPTGTANNPLSLNGMSAAQLAFINVDTMDVTVYERNVLSGSLTGDLWDLWGAGAIGMAMGVEYREESLSSKADPFKAAGDIFGFNAQESIAGKFDVYEAYAEVKVPLLTNVTLFDNLSVEAGYRVSDYSTGAGISQTWKYGVEWSIFEWLTLRAIENHAVRAPTAFELFQAGDQNFPGYGDPCNTTAINALGAGDRAGRVATCNAWFAAGGAVYPGYVLPGPNPVNFAQVNSQVESFQIGTPNLQPEIADTLTYGIVFNPDWWPVGRIGVSVDRYEIEIAGVIALRSIANILNGCIAAGGVGGDCLLAPRQADGQIDFVNQTRANANTLETSGIDVNLRWSTELEGLGLPGTFGVAALYTWVDSYTFNGGENVGFHDGTIGGGIPENRAATNFTYALDDLNFLVRWTYTGAMEQASFGTETVDAYNMYDFGSSWDIDENFQVSFGVENIFDTKPQIFTDAQIFGQFNTDGSTYDQLGRQYRFGLRWKN
jgi:iron complex outermembrane recepter protein